MRTDSLCLKSWRTLAWRTWGPWSKKQVGKMTLAAPFWMYWVGQTYVCWRWRRGFGSNWQVRRSDMINGFYQWVCSILDPLRKKSVLQLHWLWLTCLVRSGVWILCLTGMQQNSQSIRYIFCPDFSAVCISLVVYITERKCFFRISEKNRAGL